MADLERATDRGTSPPPHHLRPRPRRRPASVRSTPAKVTDPAVTAKVREVHRALERAGISLAVRLWDGTPLGPADAPYQIVLHHPWSLRALLLPPSDLSAGEAYVEGAIDLEGDPIAAMATGAAAGAAVHATRDRLRLASALLRLPRPPHRAHHGRARLRGRLHSRARDRAAIAFHYDLPQAFYETFLDTSLVYSCAYFSSPSEDLDAAQVRKLDVICRKLRLRPGMRLLDVGCGWGSLLAHAARRYGVTGLGVTLSATQAQAGRERLAAAGLTDRVEIRLADYRDLRGQFDAIASVGMFEHVGPQELPAYFATVRRLLAPGGLFLNHGVVQGDPNHLRKGTERTFVTKYVFPDGGLVPAWRAVRELERAGFELLDAEQLRPHYALTLRRWLARLERDRHRAAAVAGETDYRTWRAYMAAAAYSFESRSLGLVQLLGSAGANVPLGRSWMLPADAQPAPG